MSLQEETMKAETQTGLVSAEETQSTTPSSPPVIKKTEKARKKPALAAKPLRKKRTTPAWHADFEPEDRSWRNIWWLLWWSYGFLQLYRFQWIRTPHRWGGIKKRMQDNHDAMWRLGFLAHAIYFYRSIKGGAGKTTSTTWVGAEVAKYSASSTLIVDYDSGAKGKAALRLDIDIFNEKFPLGDVQKLVIDSGTVLSHKDLETMLPMHKESGVFLLAPSKKIIMSVNESERLLGALNPAFGVMFIDSTPGVKEDCNIGAQNRATVTIINAEYNTNEFFYDLLSIRDDMNEGEGEASGLFERLVAEKRLFIEVNSVPKAKFNRRTQYEIAKKLEIENEQVILVPYEYQIKEKSPVRRAAVSQRYLYAVSESARTLTEAAAAYNRNNPWDGPVRRIKESPARQRNRAVDRLIDLHDGIADDAAKAVLKRKLGS